MAEEVCVTVWNEFRHERYEPEVRAHYPHGIHVVVAEFLQALPGIETQTATLDEREHGLTQEVLDATDVLIWWGHLAHNEVEDSTVDQVQQRVLDGMGLICLHSAHLSKIFTRLMGTGCNLRWREADERERVWVMDPGHPIANGLDEFFEVPESEMYGERFDIPVPDDLVFLSWFQGGEVFRSGCCYRRGKGKIFYFSPGHETYGIYHQREIQVVIGNAVRWAAPAGSARPTFGNRGPLERLAGN